MKRRDLIQALESAGLELREGAKHTLVYKGGVRVSAVPRHREIAEVTAAKIAKQTGVDLTLETTMEPLIFPCIIAGPGSDGLFGVAVPGANVNGQGPTEADALADAAACLQELIDEAENLGEAPIRPGAPAEIDTMRDDGDRLGAIITRPATVAA